MCRSSVFDVRQFPLSSLSPHTSLLRPFLFPSSLPFPPLSFMPCCPTLGIKPGTLYLFGKRRITELRSWLLTFFSSFSSHPWLGGEFLSGRRQSGKEVLRSELHAVLPSSDRDLGQSEPTGCSLKHPVIRSESPQGYDLILLVFDLILKALVPG